MARSRGLYSAGIEMASNTKELEALPSPDASSVIRFLRTCPALAGLPAACLELLAGELRLVAYASGTHFHADEVPSRAQPLRFIVHGRATWESSRARQQKHAWVLGPGSALGLDVINDWAWHTQTGTAWPTQELPAIRCQAQGQVWVLELAPERFAAVFEGQAGALLLAKLLRMYPTQVFAPDIVKSLRATPTFARSSMLDLYRLLEWAPTLTLWPTKPAIVLLDQPKDVLVPADLAPDPAPNDDQPNDDLALDKVAKSIDRAVGHALYYVIEGEVEMTIGDEVLAVSAGQLEGPDTFADQTAMKMAAPKAQQSKCSVVMIPAEAVWKLICSDGGFARNLGPLERSKRVL